jgi:hypothetical protein
MDKNCLYSQILYLGFVSEKNRVFKKLWNQKLKKILLIELKLWSEIIHLMKTNDFSEKDEVFINYFIEICNRYSELKKYYNIVFDNINAYKQKDYMNIKSNIYSKKNEIIIGLMEDLIHELKVILNKRFSFKVKKQLYEILSSLHNLPRFFLEERTSNLQEPMIYAGISFKDALEYSFLSMGNELNEKYIFYKKYI